MDIAIIGAGNVGGALAEAWIRRGHRIRFGVRDPRDEKVRALVARLGSAVTAHGNVEAATACEMVVLATPWAATKEAIQSCGSLARKTVIDCTNPLLPNLAGLEVGLTSSGGELVASWARGASVFKCFNQTGAENMLDQRGYAVPLVMFVAGDDAARKPAVMQLASDAGFNPVDAGPLSVSRLLEPYAMLWIHLAFRMGRGRAFGMALQDRAHTSST